MAVYSGGRERASVSGFGRFLEPSQTLTTCGRWHISTHSSLPAARYPRPFRRLPVCGKQSSRKQAGPGQVTLRDVDAGAGPNPGDSANSAASSNDLRPRPSLEFFRLGRVFGRTRGLEVKDGPPVGPRGTLLHHSDQRLGRQRSPFTPPRSNSRTRHDSASLARTGPKPVQEKTNLRGCESLYIYRSCDI